MFETTHDHEIVAGTATTKLWLARDPTSGKAMYQQVPDVRPYEARFESGQVDWTHGHGQYRKADPRAYFDGQSIDTTQEGRVLLGPLIKEVYRGTTSAKESFETGTDGYHIVGGATWKGQTFTTTSAYTIGAVGLNLVKPLGNPGTLTVGIYATAAGLPTGSALCSGTFDANTVVSATWYIVDFDVPVALTNSTVYAIVCSCPDADAATSPLYWAVDASSPSYAGGSQVYSGDSGSSWAANTAVDHYFRTYAYPTTVFSGIPTSWLWAASAGVLLCADSANVYNYANGGWNASATALTGVTHLVEHDGIIYAARGAGTVWSYSSAGTAWTATDLTDAYATKLISAPNPLGTRNVLWALKTPNELRYTVDGRAATAGGSTLSTPTYVGDTSNNATNVFISSDELMVGRTDNLYYYDTNAGVHPLKEDLKHSRSTNNFKYVTEYKGATYCSVGRDVAEILGGHNGTWRLTGPLKETGDIDKVGICVGLTSDTDYLYAAYLEETVTHIYKGKWLADGQWSWCPWVYLGTNQCEAITVAQHSATDRRLWFGYGTAGSARTGYVQITDNPTTDSTARFASSGFVRMSYEYGSHPYYNKMYQTIVTETAACTTGITLQVKYRSDASTAMTSLAGSILVNGVQATNLTSAISCKRVQFELDLATNNVTITPQVRQFIAQGTERPEIFRTHECVYELNNTRIQKTESVRAALRTAAASSSLIKFADLRFGDTTAGTAGTDYQYVVMEPGYPQEIEIRHVKGQPPEFGIKVRWREVNYS